MSNNQIPFYDDSNVNFSDLNDINLAIKKSFDKNEVLASSFYNSAIEGLSTSNENILLYTDPSYEVGSILEKVPDYTSFNETQLYAFLTAPLVYAAIEKAYDSGYQVNNNASTDLALGLSSTTTSSSLFVLASEQFVSNASGDVHVIFPQDGSYDLFENNLLYDAYENGAIQSINGIVRNADGSWPDEAGNLRYNIQLDAGDYAAGLISASLLEGSNPQLQTVADLDRMYQLLGTTTSTSEWYSFTTDILAHNSISTALYQTYGRQNPWGAFEKFQVAKQVMDKAGLVGYVFTVAAAVHKATVEMEGGGY